jgi:hypothetical protein
MRFGSSASASRCAPIPAQLPARVDVQQIQPLS